MTYIISATNETIRSLIRKEIEAQGANCSLNHIDVSQVTDMGSMFLQSQFNGDISQWDTSNITNMSYIFFGSKFAGDLRAWNKIELQLKDAFADSYEGYLEKRRIILEHAQLVDQFQVNGTKKTRSL